jgi:hypothetical protein
VVAAPAQDMKIRLAVVERVGSTRALCIWQAVPTLLMSAAAALVALLVAWGKQGLIPPLATMAQFVHLEAAAEQRMAMAEMVVLVAEHHF